MHIICGQLVDVEERYVQLSGNRDGFWVRNLFVLVGRAVAMIRFDEGADIGPYEVGQYAAYSVIPRLGENRDGKAYLGYSLDRPLGKQIVDALFPVSQGVLPSKRGE